MNVAGVRAATSPSISVVVITHNEGRNLAWTVASLNETLQSRSEILVVDDHSSDRSTVPLKNTSPSTRVVRTKRRLGIAAARNWGARQTTGDYIVFSDAHNTFSPGWQQALTDALMNPGVGAVAPGICDQNGRDRKGFGLRFTGADLEVEWLDPRKEEPYPVPLLPGGCLAMRRDTFDATGGFDEGLIRYGVEDCELSIRLWLLGYELLVIPTVEVAHLFRKQIPYPVYWKTVLHNRLRMALLHFSTHRLIGVVKAYQSSRAFPSAMALVMDSDVSARRAEIRSRRVHDDDWFFENVNRNS